MFGKIYLLTNQSDAENPFPSRKIINVEMLPHGKTFNTRRHMSSHRLLYKWTVHGRLV